MIARKNFKNTKTPEIFGIIIRRPDEENAASF
jgi:hypothetical protein